MNYCTLSIKLILINVWCKYPDKERKEISGQLQIITKQKFQIEMSLLVNFL